MRLFVSPAEQHELSKYKCLQTIKFQLSTGEPLQITIPTTNNKITKRDWKKVRWKKKCLKEAVKGCKCRCRHKFNKRRSKKRCSVLTLGERFSGIFTTRRYAPFLPLEGHWRATHCSFVEGRGGWAGCIGGTGGSRLGLLNTRDRITKINYCWHKNWDWNIY